MTPVDCECAAFGEVAAKSRLTQVVLSTGSGVATGWTGADMSTPLLLEVAPEIDTNPTSFYRGKG